MLKYKSICIFLFFFIILPFGNCFAADNNVLISWGDYVILYGMETDPALDTAEGIRRVMKRWKGRGYTGVYWRSDFEQYDPNIIIRQYDKLNPVSYGMINIIDEAASGFDVAVTARQIAEELGLDFWIYHTGVYMDGASADSDVSHQWAYVTRYIKENPEALTVDRQGNPYYSVREYACPGAIETKVAEFEYMAKEKGIKNFYASMRSEAEQMQEPPRMADQYGFNQPVVDAMLSRYGVNILTDPRFDIDNPNFDPLDPMVEKWHHLRGEYLTDFWRQLRTSLDAIDPEIKITTRIPGGDYIGRPFGNWVLDWRTWIDEGLIDELIIYGPLGVDPHYADKKYITNTYPVSTFRDYINNSNHPDTKIIVAGQFVYTPRQLLNGSDGWRTVWGKEAYDLAWYQRWQKWKEDIAKFGGIRYIMQDFDAFSIREPGYDKGWGNMLYNNKIRACEGYWYTRGYDTNAMPRIQDNVVHGTEGKSLMLIDSTQTSMDLLARHWSDWLFVDPSISGGELELEYWIYRPYSGSSYSVLFEYDGSVSEKGPAMKIGTGVNAPIYYYYNSSWVSTGHTIGLNSWHKFTIKANLENKTFSIFIGDDNKTEICRNIQYPHPTNRFNQLRWVPSSAMVYIDDVLWLWKPDFPYQPKSNNTYLADSFETHNVSASVVGQVPDEGFSWQCSGDGSNFYIENDLSFGNGYKTLAAKREAGSSLYSGSLNPIQLDNSEVITFDFDLYMPGDNTLVNTQKSEIALHARESLTEITAGVYLASDIFYWDGLQHSYVNTGYPTPRETWFHIQIAIDNAARKYKVVLQKPGDLPELIASGDIDTITLNSDQVFFLISPQGSEGSVSYLDNIEITYGMENICGDEIHPYPIGDLDKNCIVNFEDVSLFFKNWLGSSI